MIEDAAGGDFREAADDPVAAVIAQGRAIAGAVDSQNQAKAAGPPGFHARHGVLHHQRAAGVAKTEHSPAAGLPSQHRSSA